MADRHAPEALQQRSAMLRRVYEDNLRLRDISVVAPEVRDRSGKRLLVLFACLVAVAAGHVASLHRGAGDVDGPSHFQTGEAVAGVSGVSQHASATTRVLGLPIDPLRTGNQQLSVNDLGKPSPAVDSTGVLEPTTRSDAEVTREDESIDLPAYAAPLVSGDANIKKLFGLSVRTIVVDAGHGGRDPGTIGTMGLREKDVTLDVARRLKEKLQQDGSYRVLLVRDEDVTVPLSRRVAFANSFETDLFISIHVNYLPGTAANAVQTYYFGSHRDSETRKLAERENAHSDFRLSEFESVLRNMQDTIKLQESTMLAHAIQRSLLDNFRRANHKVLDTGVRPAPFVVLLGVKAPSVLAEISSLSSAEAEQDLEDKGYRDKIASYLASGIHSYLDAQPLEEDKSRVKSKSKLAEHQ